MMEELIENFYRRSLSGTMHGFPFMQFYTEFKAILYEKLALHGCLTMTDYIMCLRKYYDMDVLKQFAYKSDHVPIDESVEDIEIAIFRPRYNILCKQYDNDSTYRELFFLYIDLTRFMNSGYRTEEQVENVERCIHAMHKSGYLLDDITLEKIRKKMDDLCYDKLFGVLTRNGLDDKISQISKPFNAVLLDFSNFGKLNEKLGYQKVNKLMRQAFGSFAFRKTDIVGRYFSGDEICIITSDNSIENLVERFKNHVAPIGLSFSYRVYHKIESIDNLGIKND